MIKKFGDQSGVTSAQGYEYQKLVAIYYLIVQEASEILYEVDGEDFAIINEDVNRDSIEYIQVKKISVGSFSLAKFKSDVFPQFWSAYSDAVDKHKDKAIFSTLIISCQWDASFKLFIENCTKLRICGMTSQEFESAINPHLKIYQSMRKSKNPQKFFRFLWGLKLIQSFNQEYVEMSIIDYLKSCNIRQPREKLAIIKNIISETGQGRITRNQIEEKINEKLAPAETKEKQPVFSVEQLHSIFDGLEKSRVKYGFEGTLEDEEKMFRDMYQPINRSKKAILNLYEKRKSEDIDLDVAEELYHVTLTDCLSAEQDAKTIASLTNKLCYHKLRYGNRIKSLQSTAYELGYIKKV